MFVDGNGELAAKGPSSGESRLMFLGTIFPSIALTPTKKKVTSLSSESTNVLLIYSSEPGLRTPRELGGGREEAQGRRGSLRGASLEGRAAAGALQRGAARGAFQGEAALPAGGSGRVSQPGSGWERTGKGEAGRGGAGGRGGPRLRSEDVAAINAPPRPGGRARLLGTLTALGARPR